MNTVDYNTTYLDDPAPHDTMQLFAVTFHTILDI